MSAKTITITREFGSGGHTIGQMVAKKLGYQFYDWNLVEKIAEETGFATQFIEENGEEQNRFAAMLTSTSFGFNLSEQLFEAQSRVIFDLAQQGSCVFVGRCADYLLRKEPGVMSCFIYSTPEERMKRIVREYGETEVPVERRMKDKDRRRISHYQYFTSRRWGKAAYYDLCIDTSRIQLSDAADLICAMARAYQPGIRRIKED